jgi:hypothetical protein
MLMDMQASTEGPSQLEDGAPRRELYPSDSEWIRSAADFADDSIIVAPAGDACKRGPTYPAQITAKDDRLLSVDAVGCEGKRLCGTHTRPGRAPDLLAPGINITGASPAPAQVATLSLAGRGSLQLLVASPGSAAGKNAFPVTLATCARNGTCPKPAGSVRQLCVLQLAYGDIRSSMCTALGENTGCRAGLVVAALEGERDFNGWQAEVAQNVDGCWSSYGSSSAGVKTPVLMATAAQGANLKAAAAAVGSARGSLAVSPALHRTRSGTPQAAAWVAGAAARLMTRFVMCNASSVTKALISTARQLVNGRLTEQTGRGGLLQVQDAEDYLAKQPCAQQQLLSVPADSPIEDDQQQPSRRSAAAPPLSFTGIAPLSTSRQRLG